MLIYSHIFFTVRFSNEFLLEQNYISHHTSIVSLHYLVKCFCSKNLNTPVLNEVNYHARFSHSKQLLKTFTQ